MDTFNILLLEDDLAFREAVTEELVEAGYHVTPVAGGTEAVARIAEISYDLVIVDIFLKRGSGLGVLKALQGSAAERRVVVLSNYATADMRRTCLQLGADRVFDKSNEIDALVQYCHRLATGETGPGVLA